jgi:NAD(P)-dependent dehydrogenase (short-subunit alcohol dehydrogenase family)
MKVDLAGRVALVTGASQGIGQAIAYAFAQNGARIAVNDLNPAHNETVTEIRRRGGDARFFPGDVGDVNAVNKMVAEVESGMGPIDILVNNAGVNVGKERRPAHEFSDSDWHRIIRVDLNGVFYCSRAVAKSMINRKKGAIINISSAMAIIPIRLQCAFSAAKAGMQHFTRSQALEVGQYGVRINAIAPGSILTEGTRQLFYNPADQMLAESLLSHIPLGRPGETEDIAQAALYLASDDASYVTGSVLVVDGGWTAGFAREW